MEKVVFRHSVETPDALAVINGSQSLTYAELLAEATHLAHVLCKAEPSLAHQEPVGILLGAGIKQIVAQLAVLLVGGTCVPIDPSTPDMRITDMLHDVDVKHIILEENGPYASKDFNHVYIGDVGHRKAIDGDFEFPTEDASRSHILFTSGSTGKPKPVQINAKGIMHLATSTPATPLRPDDRVAEFNSPSFDLSLFEIWVTLLSGATVVVIPKEIATDPGSLQSFLKDPRFQVTVIIMTAALFEIVAFSSPATFKGLRHVLTAGDVANVIAMRAVLENGPPEHLWNTYGPTECVTLTTMFEITLEETNNERISIGRPVGQMQVYLLDPDEELKPIHESGKRGEICIAGPQQSPGYLNRTEENEENFIEFEKNKLGIQNGDLGDSSRIRLYRTGDMAEWRLSGDLDFIGRIDNQVKHGGFRVELGEIEKVLLSSSRVKSAVVVRQPSLLPNGSASLIAFVIPNIVEDFDHAEMLHFLQQRLPWYMVPNEIKAVDKFPLTNHGKVDRRALIEHNVAHQEKRDVEPSGGDSYAKFVIKGLWKEILNLSEVKDDDDFIALGASSLQSAWFIALVQKRLGVLISMRDLHLNSRLPDLLALIEKAMSSETGDAPDDTAAWMQDVDLVDEIELVPDWQSEAEGRVFITGVTGFVGAFFLQNLMHNPRVKQIACLARSKGSLTAAQRIQKALERYDLWPDSFELTQKIMVLEGDMSDNRLGLGERFAWLANWASTIFHLGAKVNFCESYREHRLANVIGTRNMLRLAATGRRKSFHYMSTIDVWGPTGFILGTRVLKEDGPLQPHLQALRYDIGYAASQWTAEAMVRRMRDRGLPITIYRPGFIIGHSETGAANPDDAVSRIIVGCIQLGTWPQIIDQRLEYVTVDYVVNAVMHIASSNQNLGRSYSLLSPNISQSVSVIDTCRVINEAGYDHVKVVEYATWVRHVAERQRPHGPLAPLMPLFEERVLGKLTRWESSQYSPFYESRNTLEALADRPDIQYKPLDAGMVKRFIAFWNQKGFYNV